MNNFSLRKLKMNAILRTNNCPVVISERPSKIKDDKWNKIDRNATVNLHLALDHEIVSTIEEQKTTNEAWEHLTKL